MSLDFYRILHITALILIFVGLAGVLFIGMAQAELKGSAKKWAFITHGVGLLLALISGFGMAGKLGFLSSGLPLWVLAKLGIWLVLGGAISIVKRKANLGWPLIVLIVGLGATAATLGITKPF